MIREQVQKATTITCRARLLRAAMKFVPKGPSYSHHLTGVQVEPHPSGKGILLIASDGFRLVVLYDANGTADGWAVVTMDPIPADSSSRSPLYVQLDAEPASCTNVLTGGVKFIADQCIDWRRFMPESCVAVPVALDLSLLSDFEVIPSAYMKGLTAVHVLADIRCTTGQNERYVCTFGSFVPAVAIISGYRGMEPSQHPNSLPDFLQPKPTDPATRADSPADALAGADEVATDPA